MYKILMLIKIPYTDRTKSAFFDCTDLPFFDSTIFYFREVPNAKEVEHTHGEFRANNSILSISSHHVGSMTIQPKI